MPKHWFPPLSKTFILIKSRPVDFANPIHQQNIFRLLWTYFHCEHMELVM